MTTRIPLVRSSLLAALALGSLALSNCKPPEGWVMEGEGGAKVKTTKLEIKDGIAINPATGKPAKGIVLIPFEDEPDKVQFSTTYKNGLKHGPEVEFRKNGDMSRETGYHQGQARYLIVRYKGGMMKTLSFYEDGSAPADEKWIGPHTRAHKNGFASANGIRANNYHGWDKRKVDWNKEGQVSGDYLFYQGELVETLFEADAQADRRAEREAWNDENLTGNDETAAPADEQN
ncbi:hypothetical protein [Sulfuriroseicoccus oceanibius]|uniref:Lipoprotein n=1 Tax=Sulfuriroseicoccus oceanibius TaxID=2707525 RepID=A0A7T7F1N5_9BACT|nr:hypothetical protein [Sulfuriroseicoccus oceanibius]QQL45141.1 hypothetical protein G3M56_000710 [Sulfuriroseicoccus oceanibius]